MSAINSITTAPQAPIEGLHNSFVASVAAKVPKSDAEVVSQVASTVIKPSNVDATSQPTREVVAKAAADLQQFVQSMGRI